MLALRRAVFNGRMPATRPGRGRVGPVRPAERRASCWPLARRPRGAGRTAAARAARWWTPDWPTPARELRPLAGEDRLRLGLALASPTLDGQLDAFIADRAAVPDKRARKKERSLLSYLYRTACKTSPFSTFTAVAAGRFRAAGDQGGADPAAPMGEGWTSHPRLNVVVLARLAELAAADPERRGDLPVALSAGWELDEDRLRYVRRSVTAGDDSAAVSFDAAHDRLFFLRRSGALERMLGLFADGARPRYADLGRVARRRDRRVPRRRPPTTRRPCSTWASSRPPGWTPTSTRPTRCAPSRRRCARWSGPGPTPPPTGWRAPPPASSATPPPTSPAGARCSRTLRAELAAVQQELGAEEPTLPQTLLYEDVRGADVGAELERWTELAAAPLHALTRILPAFDVALPQRLVLKGFFLARYGRGGRCEDVLRLVHDFHEDIFTQYLQFTALKSPWAPDGSHAAEENWLGMPEVSALDRARAAFTARMRGAVGRTPAGRRASCGSTRTRSTRSPPNSPRSGSSFAPHSHFVQLADRDRRPAGRAQQLLRRPVLPLHPVHPLLRRRAGAGRAGRDRGARHRGPTGRAASPPNCAPPCATGSRRARSSPRSPRAPRPPTSTCTAG